MYLVFDIGGTFIKYAIMDRSATIHEKGKVPTPYNGVDAFLDLLESIYHQHQEVDGIALSCPGQIDVVKGIVYSGGNLRYLHLCHLKDELQKRCDNKKVAIENDGKCAGLAEVAIGAAKDVNDAIVVVFGTGIGGAIIKDKKVHHGSRLMAGELSFVMVNEDRKSLKQDMWAKDGSAIALSKLLEIKKGKEKGTYTGEDVFNMALDQKDEDAIEILEDFYYKTAVYLYNLQYIMDPDIICIGGGISEQASVLEGIQRYIDLIYENSFQLLKPKVVKCKFHNDSNLIGALFHFLQIYQ